MLALLGEFSIGPWLIWLIVLGIGIGVPLLVAVLVLSKKRRVAGGGTAPVKVRCQKCETLNDERAKYCNQCGSAI
jgi:hypothetical protein